MYTSEWPLDVNYSNQIFEDLPLTITNTQFVGNINPVYQQIPHVVNPLAVSLSSFRVYDVTSKIFKFIIKREVETINQKIEQYLPKIVHEIKENNALFEDINEEKAIETLRIIFSKINSSDLLYIKKSELEERVVKILSVNILSNILDDFNPDQKRDFHESIQRRPLFE